VKDGPFYGWPFSYYGQHAVDRVTPQRPDLVAKVIVPNCALGNHTASLGLVFSKGHWRPNDTEAARRSVNMARGTASRTAAKVGFVQLAAAGLARVLSGLFSGSKSAVLGTASGRLILQLGRKWRWQLAFPAL
jgi:glucose/arabinose dehydrogenase